MRQLATFGHFPQMVSLIPSGSVRPFLVTIIWACLSCSLGLAQKRTISFTDSQGTTQTGSFRITYVQIIDGAETPLKGGSTLKPGFTGEGREFLEVRLSDLSWENAGFFGKLSVLNGDINPGENHPLEPNRTQKLLASGDRGPKAISYRVNEEGAYQIKINYRVSEEGQTSNVLGKIEKQVNIKFGATVAIAPPPEQEPIQAAPAQTEPESASDEPEATQDTGAEEEDWVAVVELVLDEDDPQEQKNLYQRFLQAYPTGEHAELARKEIQQIEKEIAANQPQNNPPPPSSSPPSRQKTTSDPEAKLFAAIQRSRRVKDCEQYFREYGSDGTYAQEVQEILNEVSPIKLISQGYTPGSQEQFFIKLAYAREPVTHRITGGKGPGSYWDDVWNPDDSTLTVSVDRNQLVKVRFADDRGKRIIVELDSRFAPLSVQDFQIKFSEGDPNLTESFSFQISGGDAPYFAQFVRLGETDPTLEVPLASSTGARTISISDVQAIQGDSAVLNGPYSIRFVDQRHTESVFFNQPKDLVRIYQPEPSPPWTAIGLIALGVIGLIVVLRTVNRKQASARKEKMEQKIKERQRQTTSLPPVESHSQPIQTSVSPPAKTSPTPAVEDSPPPKTRATVRITRKEHAEKGNVPMRVFSANPESSDYHRLQLTEIWPAPAVSEVYLSQEVIQQLDKFIHEENVDSFREEQNDLIPEIGGFLMGTYQQVDGKGPYQVAIEKFQPITAEEQDLYKVEFGVTAWSELADVQDMYPDLRTIGWFHTHPGHGLFLSQPDLRIQEGFFKEKFQLAMEIDTKSPGLDTTFFARNTEGVIYNSRDRIRDNWYQWVIIRETGASDPTS